MVAHTRYGFPDRCVFTDQCQIMVLVLAPTFWEAGRIERLIAVVRGALEVGDPPAALRLAHPADAELLPAHLREHFLHMQFVETEGVCAQLEPGMRLAASTVRRVHLIVRVCVQPQSGVGIFEVRTKRGNILAHCMALVHRAFRHVHAFSFDHRPSIDGVTASISNVRVHCLVLLVPNIVSDPLVAEVLPRGAVYKLVPHPAEVLVELAA